MKAFWWFKENSIAGMARPGFNGAHWFDLSFEEALVFGWFGVRSSSSDKVNSLRAHIREHGVKINPFYEGKNENSLKLICEDFEKDEKILQVLEGIQKKTKSLEHFEIVDNQINFKLSEERLRWEINFLQSQGIETLVTLTEKHHQREILEDHFELHHLAIEDLNAPQREQVFLFS